jgi:hypothetical protein
MITVNDALAREIIHASVSGGPGMLGHYRSRSHASGLRALAAARSDRSRPVLERLRRLTDTIRAAFAMPAQPACCPAP